ncbi:MAG: class I SAM-dependent methyltransferase [Candidatus Krumholzibacteriia bacterium]
MSRADRSQSPHAAALRRLLTMSRPLQPWQGTGRLPWGDPDFSRRLLETHLDPTTDQATRRPEIVDQHVAWLLDRLAEDLGSGPFHVLDAGCGPGLYCHELARRGHRATGLDIAPAALDWAREKAESEQLACLFLDADLDHLPGDLPGRIAAGFGPADAVTIWFGDLHGFAAPRAEVLLAGLGRCLRPGGLLVVEYQPLDHFVTEQGSSWEACESGPFSDEPHLWLQEYAWDEDTLTEIHGHWIIEVGSGTIREHVQCHQGWSEDDLDRLLARCGFDRPRRHPPVTGVDPELEFPMLTARRTGTGRDDGHR